MRYKNLGKSGVKVSSLCLGTMTFGAEADAAMCKQLYSLSRDAGLMYQKRYNDEVNKVTVKTFSDFCKQNDYNPASLALSWVGSYEAITAPIINAYKHLSR